MRLYAITGDFEISPERIRELFSKQSESLDPLNRICCLYYRLLAEDAMRI